MWDQILNEVDADGSQTVSWDEVIDFAMAAVEAEVRPMFDAADADGDGHVTEGELEEVAPGLWDQFASQADFDGSGGLDWDEVELFAMIMLEEQFRPYFDMFDSDGSGEVDKAEFDAGMAEMMGQQQMLAQIKKYF